jgi:putative membrane protein
MSAPPHAPCLAVAALALAFGSSAQSNEQEFLKEAVQGNIAELRLGELAMQRAESENVRKLGEMLRVDHHAGLQRATAVAKSLKVEPPTEPTTDARETYESLAQLSGGEFEAAFVSHMVVAHEAEIAKYSRNSNSDHDGVAALVVETIPKLKSHLAAAQALQRGAPHSQH